MHRNRLIILALVALAAALIAGCGGGDDESTSTDDYSAQMQDELATFATEFSALGQEAASPTSVEDYTQAVTQIQDRIEETIANLDEITPPDELADIHSQLITTFQDLDDAFAPIIDAAQSGDKQQIQQAVLDLQQANADFQTKFADLSSQAADLGAPIEDASVTTSTESTTP